MPVRDTLVGRERAPTRRRNVLSTTRSQCPGGPPNASQPRTRNRDRAASLLAAAAVALPAHAESRTFRDKIGDTGVSGDLKTVRVNHSEHRLIVVARTGNLLKADYVTVWFDTKSGNAAPEYKVVVRANSESPSSSGSKPSVRRGRRWSATACGSAPTSIRPTRSGCRFRVPAWKIRTRSGSRCGAGTSTRSAPSTTGRRPSESSSVGSSTESGQT